MEPCIGGLFMVGTKIAEYFGLIESVSTDVKKLLHKDFQSAITSLQYAINATDDEHKKVNLQDARKSFLDATSVEENENLVSALAGLAMCQYFLGDSCNAEITLSKINAVQLTTAKKAQAIGKELAKETLKNMFIPGRQLFKMARTIMGEEPEEIRALKVRQNQFQLYKQKALTLKIK